MLDPKEEAKFAELKSKCRELKVPSPPEIMIGLQVHDRNGNLIFDDIQRGHSWNRNYWNSMMFLSTFTAGVSVGGTFGVGYLGFKNTAGAALRNDISSKTTIAAAVGDATAGIVMGTSDTAFDLGNYTLGALIANGVGAGQFSYQICSSPTPTYTAGTKTWGATFTRIVNNNSGSEITVKETGLLSDFGTPGGGMKMLVERSVLSPTVAVANGAQLTVTYEISMDFSAID